MQEAPFRILYVEPDLYSATSIGRIIARKLPTGHEIYHATSSEDALRYARKNPVDLVLTALRVASKDGIEVISEINRASASSQRGNPNMYLFTGSAEEDLYSKVEEAGGQGVIIKGTRSTASDLERAMSKALERLK